ncbi:EAL domain-containing protein [Nitrogeniibacter mangrovi]|uniref:EAL domain-containing protein n=1 Tax=Nitrogeniibacter mangrovi TaxID=2016596 RepID=A0A6C1B3I1_9RHOO|nr:EAL domain-containing protein [Nitrogeniibacter mangrovi]QID17549.1 EAL domain-containing protein [Nitrogeniibacter mangrovi]
MEVTEAGTEIPAAERRKPVSLIPDPSDEVVTRLSPVAYALIVFFMVVIGALWWGIGHQLDSTRESVERNTRKDLSNLSLAFGEHIRSLAQGLDQTLVGLREHWAEGRTAFEAAVHRYRTAVDRDYNIQIAVIDRDGRLAYSNLDPNVKPISLVDREHFRVHRDSGRDRLFISKPVLGRVSKRWSIQFTRPILGAGGQFDGVLVMSVTPDYFSEFYQRIGLGADGAINLQRGSGEVLARSPPLAAAIGTRIEGLLPATGAASDGALVALVSPIDKVRRLYAVRNLPDLGLVVSVGRSVRSIAAASAQERNTLTLVGAGATIAILAFAISVLGSLANRSRAARRMARARERDRVLLTALEAAPSGIVVTDAEVNIQWANPAFERLTGYSIDEAIGAKPAELVKSGQQGPAFYERMWAALRSGLVWGGELVNRRKDGSLYDEELVIAPVRNEQGQTTHFVGIKQDVTDRKRAERELAVHSERNEMLLRMATDGIYIVDEGGRIVEANEACSRMLGYTREQLLSMTVFDLDSERDHDTIRSIIRELFDGTRERLDFDTRHRAADGRLVDVEVSAGRVTVGEGALLYTSVRDITERKRLVAALAETEQLWKFALDGSGVGVYDWNLLSGEVAFSETANALLGIEPDDPVNRIEAWEARVHPLDAPQRRQALEALMRGETPSYLCEYRYRIPSGHWKWILSRGAVIRRTEDGAPARMVGTFADIDADKRKREQAALRTRVMETLTRGGSLGDILALTLTGLERNNFGLVFAMLMNDGDHRLRVVRVSEMGHDRLADRVFTYTGQIVSAGSGLCLGELIDGGGVGGPFWQSLEHMGEGVGLVPCWSEPVCPRSERAEGVLVAFGEQGQRFVPPDLPELQQNAALIAIAIDRKQSDEALRLAASVYEASSEAVLVVDPDNRIVAVNPAFTETTGYTLDEVIGQDPKVLASGRHDASFYREMWQSIVTTGSWRGELWNRRKNGDEYVEWVSINTVLDEAGEVQRRVAVFSDVSERKAAEEMVWRKANYDSLTGLPNRQLFLDRVEQALVKAERDHEVVALLFIDLDHFKDVNDTLGHEAGDRMLQEAARRIRACVRQSDTVARLGGDEFTVLLTAMDNSVVVERVVQSITERLAEPFGLGAESAYVSASVGITLYPQDGQTVQMLFKQADQAMYAAKAAGCNGYSWFTPAMQRAAELRHDLAKDMRVALAEGQFELYYQPIMALAGGRVDKAEALIRWHHPVRGQIAPAVFIPIAEDTGLINDIGAWVFAEAIRTAARWNAGCRDGAPARLALSVNKSPREFMGTQADEAWVGRLEAAGLPPGALIVEITEGLLLDDRAEVTDKLQRFRSMGLQLALDDFGTGYSAMSYLQRYDIDFLKIDRAFVKHLANSERDRAIAEAVIAMAHKLGIQVVAEGVEDAAQQAILANAGCDFVQGFLCAPPLPAAQFEARFLAEA